MRLSGDHKADKEGAEAMFLVKEGCLTEMEAMRPKEKTSHKYSAVIHSLFSNFQQLFCTMLWRMTEKGLEAKLYQ